MRGSRIGRRLPRLVTATAVGILVVGGVVGFGGVAAAGVAPAGSPAAEAAAGWLAGQLVDGRYLADDVGGTPYPDAGLTADAVLAFDSAGVAQDAATRATAWLATPDVLTGYVGDGGGESYVGARAKLALVAEAQGTDPTVFGGVDLLGALGSLQAPSGRFSDRSAYGDYSNGITQALAILALHRHGDATTAAASYLATQQCADGGFPLALDGAANSCAADVDTTGYAVQALLAVGNTAAADRGMAWLASVQQADGGFGGSGPTAGENANSTGLAAQALRVGGRDTAADRAVTYLTARQVGCSGAVGERGAIAYDSSGFDASNAPRATAQAVPGLDGVGLAEVAATGATATAPTLPCTGTTPPPGGTSGSPSPSSTPPVTTSPSGLPTGLTTSPTAVNTARTADGAPTVAPVGYDGGGGPSPRGLAHTGASLAAPLGVGGALLVGGAAAVVAARRRSAHQDGEGR